MRALVFAVGIFFVIVNFVNSKDSYAQSTYTFSGYVVTNAFDTIFGVIDNTDMWDNTKPNVKIEYIDEEGKNRKKTFGPDDCRFFYTHVLFESLEISVAGNFVKIFVRKVIDGELSLYHQQYTSYSSRPTGLGFNQVTASDVDAYYFKRRKEYVLQPAKASKGRLSKYFDDCESLVVKIKNDELTKKDAPAIVDYYNSECGQK